MEFDITMFKLIVEDFEATVRTTDCFSAYGNVKRGAEFNWEFADTLRELFKWQKT